MFASPTGGAVRGEDTYGSGSFHASRANGKRLHLGTDFVAAPGAVIASPISGTVTKLGYAYRNDSELRVVTIQNQLTGYSTRVMYVDPAVTLGQELGVGYPVGKAQDLTVRYPKGITNHVHVEMTNPEGITIDPEMMLKTRPDVLMARGQDVVVPIS
jgi:hypothetical protein